MEVIYSRKKTTSGVGYDPSTWYLHGDFSKSHGLIKITNNTKYELCPYFQYVIVIQYGEVVRHAIETRHRH